MLLQSLRHGKPCHLPLHKGGLSPPAVHLKGVTHYTMQGKECEKEYEQCCSYSFCFLVRLNLSYGRLAFAVFLFSPYYFLKHSLQYTGRSSRGWKGTWQGFPQLAQTASYIWRSGLPSPLSALRLSRQALQRRGLFSNPFSA